jgi:hypothetical protein
VSAGGMASKPNFLGHVLLKINYNSKYALKFPVKFLSKFTVIQVICHF